MSEFAPWLFRAGIRALLVLALLGLTACGAGPTPAPARATVTQSAPTRPPAATVTGTPLSSPATVAPATTATTAAPTAPASPPPVPLHPQVVVLAEQLSAPDDLALAPDGSLYLTDVNDGTLERYARDGRVEVLLRGLQEPEGIAVLPGGSLLIAEQGRNRLVHYDPATGVLTPWLDLANTTGQAGVDGLGLDLRPGAAPAVIIPDSPNGVVLRAALADRAPAVIARGLARPTSAWVEGDGSILVTDENAGALVRIRPDGTVVTLARLPVPDDVVEDAAGKIFVSTLGDGAIHLLDAAGDQDTVLVRGLSSPQGLAFDADGNLVVTDPGHHRLIRLVLR